MSDLVAPAPSTRSPSPDAGRVGRGGSAADASHDQSQPASAQTADQDASSSGGTRGDPAVILSSTLTHLQSGQRFAAVVIGQIPDGRLVLDSPQGVFVVDLKTSLALGSLAVKTDILLQVVTVGENIEAAVVAVNNVHVHPPRPVVLTLADVHGGAGQTDTFEAAEPIPARGTPQTLPTAAKEAQAPDGAKAEQATSNVVNAVKPDPAQAAESGPIKATATSAVVGQVLTVEPATLGGSPAIKPGAQLRLTIVAVDNGAQDVSEPPARNAPPAQSGLASLIRRVQASPTVGPQPKEGVQVQATVITRPAPITMTRTPVAAASTTDANSETEFLQTPFGLMRVANGPKLPNGAKVTVEISEVVTPPAPAPRPVRPPFDRAGLEVADLTRDWSGLAQALKSAGVEVPPQMQGHVVVPALAALPPPTPTASLQFLLAALRLGDVKGWLGQDMAAQIDQSGNAGIMSRVGNDFAAAARAAHDGGGSEWRPVVLPVHDGTGIQPVAWFIRRPYDTKDGEAGAGGEPGKQAERGTRFVIELDHRSLGEMQLDGLVQAKRFDLVVRSHRPLSTSIRQDLSGLFRKVLDGAGADGDVMFHTDRKFPVTLRADMAHRAFEARPHPERA